MTGEYHWILARPMLLRRAAAHKGQARDDLAAPASRGTCSEPKSRVPTGLHKIRGRPAVTVTSAGYSLASSGRGWSDKQDGHWEIDHVTQRRRVGGNTRANRCPAVRCVIGFAGACTGDGLLRELLLMGSGRGRRDPQEGSQAEKSLSRRATGGWRTTNCGDGQADPYRSCNACPAAHEATEQQRVPGCRTKSRSSPPLERL